MSEEILNNNQGGEFADLVGINITKSKDGYAEGSISISSKHYNKMGILHGGLLYTLADTVAGSAALSLGYKVVTLSSDFNYFKKAANVKILRAKGKVIKKGSTISVVDVEVNDQNNILLAKGTFTFYNQKIKTN